MADWRKIEDSLKEFRKACTFPRNTFLEKQAFIAWLEFEVKTWRMEQAAEKKNG